MGDAREREQGSSGCEHEVARARRSPPASSRVDAASPTPTDPAQVLRLQRAAGNAAVVRLLGRTVATGGEGVDVANLPLLRFGSTGEPVRFAQTLLGRSGPPVAVDGVFGPQTYGAVQAFQQRHGLVPDGAVGPDTWPVLQGGTGTGTGAPPKAQQKESRMEVPHKATPTRAEIFFPTDRRPAVDGAVLSDDDKDVIRRLAFAIKKSLNYRKFPPYDLVLLGYADLRGSEQDNLVLAERRIQAVEQELFTHFQLMDLRLRIWKFPQGEIPAGSEDWSDAELAAYRRVDVDGAPLAFKKKKTKKDDEQEKEKKKSRSKRWRARLIKSSLLPPFSPFRWHTMEVDLTQLEGHGFTGNFTYSGFGTELEPIGGGSLPEDESITEFETSVPFRFVDFVGQAQATESTLAFGPGTTLTTLSLLEPKIKGEAEIVQIDWARESAGAEFSGYGTIGHFRFRD